MLFRRVSRSLVPIPLVFFFFKQKSAYEMRISDWSSDVCSSDLGPVTGADVFRTMYCETEPMPFLGDVMLWAILAAMNRAERPPFAVDPATALDPWQNRRLVLTSAGEDVPDRRIDWPACRPPEACVDGRSVGGRYGEGGGSRCRPRRVP